MYIALLQATLHYCKVSRGHERELKRPWEQTLGLNHGPLDAVIDLNNQRHANFSLQFVLGQLL